MINYLMGILFIALLVAAIVLVWLFALVILKFFCSSSFLSGKRFQPDSRHKTPVRIVFLIAAAIWITCISLAVTQGVDNLQNSITTVSRANRVSIGIEMSTITIQILSKSSLRICITLYYYCFRVCKL